VSWEAHSQFHSVQKLPFAQPLLMFVGSDNLNDGYFPMIFLPFKSPVISDADGCAAKQANKEQFKLMLN
jgi:hypothetical protein